jgi:hypothetical protein
MAGELIIPKGLVISGSMDLSLSPPTASVAEGTTMSALSVPAYQIEFDYDQLEGTFDTHQTGSLNIQGSVILTAIPVYECFQYLLGHLHLLGWMGNLFLVQYQAITISMCG